MCRQLLLLIAFALLAVPKAYALDSNSVLVRCDYCSTQQDFNNFALSSTPYNNTNGNAVQPFEFLVVNDATTVIYDIIVFNKPADHTRWVTSSINSGSDVTGAYRFWMVYFASASSTSNAGFALQSNGGEGMGGFLSSEQGVICTAFTGTADFVQMAHELNGGGPGKLLYQLLKIYVGRGPTAVFIFGNGDVATYYIYPDNPGVTACGYVKGSARDATGQFINDRGMGGNGSSNGSNYVRSTSPSQYDIIGIGKDTTLSCSYIQHIDGSRTFLGCVENP